MNGPKKYIPYTHDTKCSVSGCFSPAEFEVYLWDYYNYLKEEFFEQDFTSGQTYTIKVNDKTTTLVMP
jgi:hypothetical protein